ncbi:MAG: hypothetical protein K0U93_01085 [Gammaproteobacteria bacterium]|nr:hypothetical protein [Gammaproteobacteria bacterium]
MSTLLRQFEFLGIDPDRFGHREHLQAGYEMLRKYPFLEASSRYAVAINAMATRAGAPEKFHVTVTLAFLSLIAERLELSDSSGRADFDAFIAANQELLAPNLLERWYSPERLHSELARSQFVLPDRVP